MARETLQRTKYEQAALEAKWDANRKKRDVSFTLSLLELRLCLGLSQSEFATEVSTVAGRHYSKSYVAMVESNRRAASDEYIAAVRQMVRNRAPVGKE